MEKNLVTIPDATMEYHLYMYQQFLKLTANPVDTQILELDVAILEQLSPDELITSLVINYIESTKSNNSGYLVWDNAFYKVRVNGDNYLLIQKLQDLVNQKCRWPRSYIGRFNHALISKLQAE